MVRRAESSGREELARALRRLLPDEYILLAKMRNYLRDLEGSEFHGQRDFIEVQSRELGALVEALDRAGALAGGRPPQELRSFLEHAELKHQPGVRLDPRTMISDLLDAHESLLRRLREAGDKEPFEEVSRGHERMARTLRILLQGQAFHQAGL